MRPTRVLCVAEKPSIAKSITQILSGGRFTTRQSGNTYIRNYDFDYPQVNATFTVTAVAGHMLEHNFSFQYAKWTSCDPFELFEAPIIAEVRKDAATIAQNLKNEARRAHKLMIWTDCDREGEHIGWEIMRECMKVKPNIVVTRARFSAIIPQQIHNAAQNPVALDMAQVNAVEARILLDLRIGAAMSRLQTLNLQRRFQDHDLSEDVISYGPCQFPTLGFVVSRYNQVKAFRPEMFWYIFMSVTRQSPEGEDEETVFTWRRGHLFDFDVAMAIYEHVLESPIARVVEVRSKDTKKWKPLPLTTVDLQKAGSRLLRMSPKKVLDIAEKLYQQGFLSYPRTETDRFDPQFDFMSLIEKQAIDPAWGDFATRLQNGGFNRPRQGRKDDKAHPPIHPTAHAGNLVGDEKKVYEYITRRFLACCSKDALGWETTVEVLYGDEEFYATGLRVRERNYLDVFIYDKWSDKELPHFERDEEFAPSICLLKDGQTTKPHLLTEADLVTMMDKNGIGTDATIAQHIETIVKRKYVHEKMQGSIKYLIPSALGIGLVEGYDSIGFERSLSRPQLRRETERRMVNICEGTMTRNDMLVQSIEEYKEMYIRARAEFERLVTCVRDRLREGVNLDDVGGPDDAHDGGGGGGGARGGRGGRGARGGRGSRGGRGGGVNPGDNNSDDDGDGDGGAGTRGAARGRGSRGGRRAASTITRAPSTRRGRGGRGGGAAAAPAAPPIDVDGSDSDQYWDDPPAQPQPAPQPVAPVYRPPSPRAGRSTTTRQPETSSLAAPKCECGDVAVERTVKADTANKGRLFWACPNNRRCDFFEWADGPSNASAPRSAGASRSTSIPTKRSASDRGADRKRCLCELSAVLKETKSGNNQGKKYWSCPNESAKARCRFFEWATEEDLADAEAARPRYRTYENRSDSRNSNRNYGGPVSGACYKCGEEGHWANACPNGDGFKSSSRTTSTTGKRGRGNLRRTGSGRKGAKRGKKNDSFAAEDW
ncbi:prokaryotic type I DNA topoisomerase [Daedalea quercina L-15889]|uniref:DNA topoisomerase n=1 Tax=Daedalea quercina L-15889 TaxID=1314783 RepID=A0A165L1E5_9APHY|nr:prokaryotic type I DNA topoisomerase [Daedalea quercina L-15889]